jgi:CBS domain-containing protein
MDGQYRFIQNAMDGTLFRLPDGLDKSWWQWTALFGLVAVFKCVATALTVGSGASGGALGPSVFIGGAVGAFLGALIYAVAPNAFGPAEMESLRKALIPVGMAGVLAASMRTPMAAVVMVTEMTGSYGLIVPLMLVCSTAYVVGRRWGLNSAQVRSASESPAHAADLLVHTLQALRVRDVMVSHWPFQVPASATLGEIVAGAGSGTRPVFAVVNGGELVGIVSLTDISRLMSEPGISSLVIAQDIMTPESTTVDPDEDLYGALELFNYAGHDVLPVVSKESGRFEGMLARHAIHETIRSRTSELRGHLQREHAGLIAVEQDEQLHQLMLGVSAERLQSVQRMPVPFEVVGKSIRESNFGQEYHAQVIGILHPEGRLQCPPDIDTPLQRDQMLVVIVGRPTPDPAVAQALEDPNGPSPAV